MPGVHGVSSFNRLRSRAHRVEIAGQALLVPDLNDIIASKRAAGRPRDKGVLEILERTLREKKP